MHNVLSERSVCNLGRYNCATGCFLIRHMRDICFRLETLDLSATLTGINLSRIRPLTSPFIHHCSVDKCFNSSNSLQHYFPIVLFVHQVIVRMGSSGIKTGWGDNKGFWNRTSYSLGVCSAMRGYMYSDSLETVCWPGVVSDVSFPLFLAWLFNTDSALRRAIALLFVKVTR